MDGVGEPNENKLDGEIGTPGFNFLIAADFF